MITRFVEIIFSHVLEITLSAQVDTYGRKYIEEVFGAGLREYSLSMVRARRM